MCIAILNKQGQIGSIQLENSWKNNNEGGGLMWVQDGKLQTFKTYKYNDFEDMYFSLRSNPNIGNVVLHFRIATSGFKNPINLHPFLVNEDLGFVHNGIISGLGTAEHSDTYQFNELLQKLPTDFLSNESIVHFISEYITSSKLIFLDSQDNYCIMNEKFGHWDKEQDNWFSNDSYKSYNDWVYFGNTKVSRSTDFAQPTISKKEKKRKARANRKYVSENFLNVTEFRIDWLEDLFDCSIDSDEFIEKLEAYYELTWESDLIKLTEYIQEAQEREAERDSKDFDSFYPTETYGGRYNNLDFYDQQNYKSKFSY
jgi:hypothetical protein